MRRPTNHQLGQWYPRLYRTALRMTGNLDDAADLTQEALCKALGKWDDFDGGVLVTTWLHRILANCVCDWRRRQAVRRSRPLDELALKAVRGRGVTGDLAAREQSALLREAIEALPTTLRATFVFAVMDGYAYQQVADLLSIPVGTVASRVHQARKQLCATVRQAFPEA